MLTLKRIPIDSYRENVAFVHRDCVDYQVNEFNATTKVEIHGGLRPIWATVNLVEDESLVGPEDLGLSLQAYGQINLPEGAEVSIAPAPPPVSLDAIRRKIHGSVLSQAEYQAVIKDIAASRFSKMEIAAFLVASAGFMTAGEVLALTEAIEEGEHKIKWPREPVVDHHCVGGLLGNRTEMVIVPIIAAYGLMIPKIATRAITSPCGTADAMEVLSQVTLEEHELMKVAEAESGCIVWGDFLNLAPADAVMRSVERPLNIFSPQQLVATVLAKKIATGITHLLVDIPVGPKAKVRTMSEAMHLRKLFEHVGDMSDLVIDVTITDGGEPVGSGIGPTLEARDVMAVLRRSTDAPEDLREKSLFLAGRMLEFDTNLRGGQGYYIAKEILDSGRALEAMNRIIHAQGKAPIEPLGQFSRDIAAPCSGTVDSIDSSRIARIAGVAGSPGDKGAGIDLLKKVGDFVERGQPLYRIHANDPNDFAFANGLAEGMSGYIIHSQDPGIESI